MKAVHITGPGTIAIVDIPAPKPKSGEALLKILYCGICGSDVQTYTGNQPFASYPRIPGHEFSARIEAIGTNDRGLTEGMIVTAVPYFNCGACHPCRTGRKNCCEKNETMGVQRDGCFAEYIVMPVDHIIDGKSLSPKTLSLIEPFSISAHAISRGGVRANDNVLVIGTGPIGMFAVIAAKRIGARVHAADVFDDRLSMARSLGADGVINTKNDVLKERVAALTDGAGMDVCVEAAGLPETFLAAIDAAAFSGTLILIGNGKRETTFNHSILLKKELSVFGSRNSLNDFPPLIDAVASGRTVIDRLITDVYPFSDAVSAFERLRNNDGSTAKVLVSFE
ncbi:MAG: zinc-binding alcohol dehydrogenase family protein [Spirochaetota bacterium]